MPQTETKAGGHSPVFKYFTSSVIYRLYTHIIDQLGKWFVWHKNVDSSDKFYNSHLVISSASYDDTGEFDTTKGASTQIKETELVDYIYQTVKYGLVDSVITGPASWADDIAGYCDKLQVTNDQYTKLNRQIKKRSIGQKTISENNPYNMSTDITDMTANMDIDF